MTDSGDVCNNMNQLQGSGIFGEPNASSSSAFPRPGRGSAASPPSTARPPRTTTRSTIAPGPLRPAALRSARRFHRTRAARDARPSVIPARDAVSMSADSANATTMAAGAASYHVILDFHHPSEKVAVRQKHSASRKTVLQHSCVGHTSVRRNTSWPRGRVG